MAKPLLLGRKEIASLYNIAPTAVSDNWVRHGIIAYEDAVVVSGKPFWPGASWSLWRCRPASMVGSWMWGSWRRWRRSRGRGLVR